MTVKRLCSYSFSFEIIFLFVFLFLASATTVLVAQTPVAEWKFDEGTGNVAFDSSGNGYTAQLSSGIRWVYGAGGWAIAANSSDQGAVSIPSLNLSATQASTISFWVNRRTRDGGVLIESGSEDLDSSTGFALLADDETCHGLRAVLHGNGGVIANCYGQPSSGVWHHLAIVYDKSKTGGDQISLYVDGVEQNPTWNLASATNTNAFGNDPVYLFSRAGRWQFSSGMIRDLRIYNRALNASQVQQIYSEPTLRPAPPPGLVAAYSFNEGSGSTVADSSGNGNTGIISNATWTAAGKYGNALIFNGQSSLITVNDASSLRLSSAMTLEAWVNPVSMSGTQQDVLSKGDDDYFLDATSNKAGYPAGGATLGSSGVLVYGSSVLPVNSWTHLAASYDGSSVRLYVNGLLVSTQSRSGPIATSSHPLQIGGDGISGKFFEGIIDEVRIYNTALTQSQIQSDMNTPIGPALVSISVTAASPSIVVTGQQQFTATGVYSDGSHQDLTGSVIWTSRLPSVAIVDAKGMATGVAVGSAPLQASLGLIYGVGSLGVTPAGFTIVALPASVSIAQGSQGTSTITTTVLPRFDSPISLSATGMPTGTTVSFNPNPIPAGGIRGNSTMTISVGSNTPTGTYPITVTGTGGGAHNSTTVTLTVTGAPSFTISASPSTLTVAQGNQGTSTITTAISNGFNSSITLSASGMPSGTTVSFNPNPIPAPGSGNSTMTITVGSSTPTGTYPITVTGTGGGVHNSTTVTLTVTGAPSFTISASPSTLTVAQGNQGTSTITTAISNGFNSSISLSASGVPSGTTVSFNPNPIPAPGSGSSTMTITVGSSTPTGTYPITVTGTGGGVHNSTTVTLTVTGAPSFTISASPSTLIVAQGNQGTSTITTAISNGFNSSITLSASGMPSGTAVSFNPNPIPAPGSGSSTMTITVGTNTATGTYPITVTGNGGGVQQSTTVTLTVAAPPSFTISALPTSLSLAQGNQGTSTVTTTALNGFNNSIALSASGMPSGITVSFNPSTIPAPGSGTSTMTVAVGSNTPTGTYPLTVTGTGGGVQQSAVVTLTVTASTGIISYVQGNYATPQSPQTTVNVVFSAAQIAGDLNVVVVGWSDSTSTVTSVVDSDGNQYTRAVGPTSLSGSATQSIYYAKNIVAAPAGSNTVTVTFSTGVSYPDIRILEYSGADPNNPVDVTAANTGNSSSSNSGSASTTSPTDLILGANYIQTITSGPGSGFTSRMITQPDGDIVEDQMVTSIGSYSATAPLSSSGWWIMQMVAFRTPAVGNFTISASPSSLTVASGNQGTSTITTAISGGFSSAISLSASGVPSGTTVSFSPNPIAAPGSGNSTMTITVGANTPTGTYPITVTGNGGGVQQSTTVTLTVTSQPTFTVSASPSSLTVLQETQGTSTITVTVSNGFNNSVSLSASGMPSGTTVTFNPATLPAPGSGTSTMTITVGTTLQGTYPLTVTASGGGIYQTATVNLTVTAEVMLTWTASQSPGIAGYNIYRSTTSGGPYTQINSSLDPNITYNDTAVQDGTTYYYVTTAVNNQGQQSTYSNQSSATVP